MKKLDDLVFDNLEILNKLKSSDNLICKDRKTLEIDNSDEFVNIDNNYNSNIEYSFYFTFMRLFTLRGYNFLDKTELYHKIDNSIDNIYENIKLNDIIDNDESLSEIMDEIDNIYLLNIDNINEDYIDIVLKYFNDFKNNLKSFSSSLFNNYLKNIKEYMDNRKLQNNKNIIFNELQYFHENRSAIKIQKNIRRWLIQKDN